MELHGGALRGCGHLSLTLRTPPSHHTHHSLPTKYPEVGVGAGKMAGAERGSWGLSQEDKSQQRCHRLLLICAAFLRRWLRDEEGDVPCEAWPQINRRLLPPLLQTTALPPSGSRAWKVFQAEDVGEALLFLLLLPHRVPRG